MTAEYEELYRENNQLDEEPETRPSFNWAEYEKRLLTRKSKNRSYMDELLEPYLKHIRWGDQTFSKDITAVYIAANFYWKRHLPAEFTRLLEWVKTKDSLYPKQLVKLLYKK